MTEALFDKKTLSLGASAYDVPEDTRKAAVRAVASRALDADDLRHLLDMLGLTPTGGVGPEPQSSRAVRRGRAG